MLTQEKLRGKILIIGSSNTDMVIKTKKFPGPGETVIGGSFLMNAGGKGANQAVAAARLGGNVSFVAKTGNDIFGKQAIQLFKKEGINTEFIVVDKNLPTGVALITVDENGENSIVVAPGANANLTPFDLQNVVKEIDDAEIILMQLETTLESVLFVSQLAISKGKKVILNPAPAQKIPEDAFSYLYIITPNESETELLTGIKPNTLEACKQAAEVLIAKGVANVIITRGSKGAYIYNKDIDLSIPAPKVNTMDTTAAGDVFNGALVVALSEQMNLEEAVRFAVVAAAISVTKMGAQSSAPNRSEVEGFRPLA